MEKNNNKGTIQGSELHEALLAEKKERNLKNEAYAFIQSQGLTSMFHNYINQLGTTREQDLFYNYATRGGKRGLWITSDTEIAVRKAYREAVAKGQYREEDELI